MGRDSNPVVRPAAPGVVQHAFDARTALLTACKVKKGHIKKLNLAREKRLLCASARRTFCTVGDKYTAREQFERGAFRDPVGGPQATTTVGQIRTVIVE